MKDIEILREAFDTLLARLGSVTVPPLKEAVLNGILSAINSAIQRLESTHP